MGKPKNIEAFKYLIKKYKNINLADIEEAVGDLTDEDMEYSYGHYVASKLTGFGSTSQCILCKKVDTVRIDRSKRPDCTQCVYSKGYNMYPCANQKSYTNIALAKNSEELLLAFKNRAKYMKGKLKRLKLE